jgi:hypothetical protein
MGDFAVLNSLLVGSPVEILFGVLCWFWYFGVVCGLCIISGTACAGTSLPL